jgi:hypothetical protein
MAFKTLRLTPDGEKRLINMYRLQYSEEQISLALGVTINSLRRFLNRAANRPLRERCRQERMLANIAVRNALFMKALGTPYKEGKPEIVRDGVVAQKGEAAQAPVPGDINAIKWWQANLDKDQFKNIQQTQLTGASGGELEFTIKNKSEKELIDIIITAITEGLIELPVPVRPTSLPSPDNTPEDF